MQDDSALVSILNTSNEVEAMLYRSLLEEAGIDTLERPMEDDWFEGVKQRGLHSQLMVRAEDAERARTLIEAYREEAETGELDAETGEDVNLPAE